MTDYTIKRYNAYSREELLEALKRYAEENNLEFVAGRGFTRRYGIPMNTVVRHFGKWSAFCKAAGLKPRYELYVGTEELMQNLGIVWEKLGRQPRANEMRQPLSPISIAKYQKHFRKTWYEVCLDFLDWKSGVPLDEFGKRTYPITGHSVTRCLPRKTARQVPLTLRYTVLKRDAFRCVQCGRSPTTERDVKLQIDHIVPWSKGGETVIENLQTLCSECNLGKRDK
jgi:hypothetical protein